MISIIIPIYNAETYLKRCLDSILNQIYKNFELLLIDDGSVDESGFICDKYAILDSRVVVLHKENGGSASARNIGLDKAKGEYIVFIDADDYIEPEYLLKLIETAKRENADIVQCGFLKVGNEEEVFIRKNNSNSFFKTFSNIDFLERFCCNKTQLEVAVLWNKIYKKTLFYGLKFPEGKGIDDEFLICEIIYRAKKIVMISDILYYYVMTENSQMRSKPSLKKLDAIEAVECHLELFQRINQTRLYNMTQYRYYLKIIEGYNLVKKFFPEEQQLIESLKNKKKDFYTVLFIKEISLFHKFMILIRNYFPNFFEYLYKKVKRRQ